MMSVSDHVLSLYITILKEDDKAIFKNTSELLEMFVELKALRAFARDIMAAWPEYDIDVGDLQDIAEKHGLLKQETRYEPCGENCSCKGYFTPKDFKEGIICYRKTELLTGY
jgi:hypothetical protein